MIKILRTVEEIKNYRANIKGTLGFVPTMGALHQGHGELLKRAKNQCDHVILSIFVNPTQFNNAQDLEKYPQTFEADKQLAENLQVDAIFFPQFKDLYPDNYNFEIKEKKSSSILCGAHRPGHFEGVLTIVLKLFNIVEPDFAFFGEKDFQQLRLIQLMVEAFFLKLKIVPVEIIRENDGLAMSSRNVRLTPEQRKLSSRFYYFLKNSLNCTEAIQSLENEGFKVDYIQEWEGRRLGAVYLGEVRLIDNVSME